MPQDAQKPVHRLMVLPQAQVLPISVAVFGLAWIGQLIGHKIEGKKPSSFDDLRSLLIGPLFVLSFLYSCFRSPELENWCQF